MFLCWMILKYQDKKGQAPNFMKRARTNVLSAKEEFKFIRDMIKIKDLRACIIKYFMDKFFFVWKIFESIFIIPHTHRSVSSKFIQIMNQFEEKRPIRVLINKMKKILLFFFNLEKIMFF